MIVKDFYGTPLTPGTPVAFNFQGQVRTGEIVKIVPKTKYGKTKRPWNGEPYVTIHVRHHLSDDVSKVTSRLNVVHI